MTVLLYRSRTALPFGWNPQLPIAAFDRRMGEYQALGWGNTEMIPLKEHPMWPFLLALEQVCNRMCAHVSYALQGRTFIGCDRVRAQVSTRPLLIDRRGVPSIFDGADKLAIKPIFTKWDTSRSPRPFYMLSGEERKCLRMATTIERQTAVWSAFFLSELQEAIHRPFQGEEARVRVTSGLGLA